jgi:hypothetical protein
MHFKLFLLLFILLLAFSKAPALIKECNDQGVENLELKDSITKKGYTLLFINKSPDFDPTLKQRMINVFFHVYPLQAKKFNKHSLRKVTFIVDPAYTGVAAASHGTVWYNPEWFKKNPKDIDVVTHEVMHITQNYGDGAGPIWLTEGIADYVRYTMGVDNVGGKWTMPEFNSRQSYKDAYRVTARFLVWVEENYNKSFVKKMDAALRNHSYSSNLWVQYTGKTVDELWAEYGQNPTVELKYQ